MCAVTRGERCGRRWNEEVRRRPQLSDVKWGNDSWQAAVRLCLCKCHRSALATTLEVALGRSGYGTAVVAPLPLDARTRPCEARGSIAWKRAALLTLGRWADRNVVCGTESRGNGSPSCAPIARSWAAAWAFSFFGGEGGKVAR